MKAEFWDSTFKSTLCCGIWIDRNDVADLDRLSAALDARWPETKRMFLERAKVWRDEPQYEAIIVGV